jgi:hypothetical protein
MDAVEVDWKNTISWDGLETSNNPYLDRHGFYVLFAGKWDASESQWVNINLLYVGKAYDQTLRKRIKQPHQGYDCVSKWLSENPGYTLLVMVGVITRAPGGHVSNQLVDDAECCLIFTNQPHCNELCKGSYTGRDLLIANTGSYLPLKQSSRCSPYQQ